MKVSVIIPSYNPGEYLWECIKSLTEQTFPTKDFEIIIVLNGCNKPYKHDIEERICQYPQNNFVLLQTDTPGVSNARNIGIDHATGKTICFIDDDDKVSHNYIECMWKLMDKNAIVVSNVYNFTDATTTLTEDYITQAFLHSLKKRHSLSCWEGRTFLSSSCCKMIPVSIIGNKRFDTDFRLGEDSLFMFSLSSEISCIILSPKDCIYYRRLRTTSVSRKKRSVIKEWSNDIALCCAYTKIWIMSRPSINVLLYISRMVATWIKMLRCLFR